MTEPCHDEQHPRPVSILLVEDNPDDVDLLREMLVEADAPKFVLTHVVRLKDALRSLTQCRFDVVLLDLSLPDSEGLDTVTKMRDAASGTPIVVITGLDDEQLGLMAVRTGAQDYLVKGERDSVPVVRAICYAIERASRPRDQSALASTETPDGMLAICSFCKRIRDDEDSWSPIEEHFTKHTGVPLTHGICPVCLEREHPDQYHEEYGGSSHQDAE